MSIGNNINIGGSKKGEEQKAVSKTAPEKETASLPEKKEAEQLQVINETVSELNNELKKETGLQEIDKSSEEKVVKPKKIMLISFPVGDEEYAISIDDIREVVPTPPIAFMPQVPNYIKGVANVRGNVLAVIDLAKRVSKGGEKHTDEVGKFVLVINSDTMKFAVNVTNVPNTMTIMDSEIDSPANIINHTSLSMNHVKGIIKKDKKMIIWIDIHELVSQTQLDESNN